MFLTDIAKGILVMIFLSILFIFAVGAYAGFSYATISNPDYEKNMQDLSEKATTLQIIVNSLNAEHNNLKDQIENLEFKNKQLEELNADITSENVQLRQEINSMLAQSEALRRENRLLQDYPKTTISSNTPVQTVQITAPVATTTAYTPAFSYPSWSSRPDYPSIKAFTGVTANVASFAEGKTFEQLVNGIRALNYIDHANDNHNYAIQYADETLVKGGGDCTDKVLLLYACLKAKGYSEANMCVVSISTCDGKLNHNVLGMEDPPFDTAGIDQHCTFTIGGRKWYVIDPTYWAGMPMCSMMSYYEDCYTVGNMHFYNTESLGGWSAVPIHGLKVER